MLNLKMRTKSLSLLIYPVVFLGTIGMPNSLNIREMEARKHDEFLTIYAESMFKLDTLEHEAGKLGESKREIYNLLVRRLKMQR